MQGGGGAAHEALRAGMEGAGLEGVEGMATEGAGRVLAAAARGPSSGLWVHSSAASQPHRAGFVADAAVASEVEFAELLDAHGDDGRLDVETLVDAARHGVPSAVRGRVWCVLLGVHALTEHAAPPAAAARRRHPPRLDRAKDAARRRHPASGDGEYEALVQRGALDESTVGRIRRQVKRYRRNLPFFQSEETQRKMERVVVAHMSCTAHGPLWGAVWHHPVSGPAAAASDPAHLFAHSSVLIPLAAPFVCCVPHEPHAFACMSAFIQMLGRHFSEISLNNQLARFFMLFRSVLPELALHFEDEDVEGHTWAVSWLHAALAKELPLECVLRLWDTYLASNEGLALHPYVCLAILQFWKEDLLELEDAELRGFLQRLPYMDMDQIIMKSYNLYLCYPPA